MSSLGHCVLAIALALMLASHAACSSERPDFAFFDACDPRQVPDAACYAGKRHPASARVALATELALRFIEEHPAFEQEWNWEEGVLMYAMTELYRITDDVRIRDYYKAWIDHHIAESYSIFWSDSCPPALAAIALHAELGDEVYGEVAREVLRYLAVDALRTDEGGISHLGSFDLRTLWIDSLFMFGMVLTRWGEFDNDNGALDEMGDQLAIFADLLQSSSGLFVHAHDWPVNHDTDIYWGRGNSWVTVATADYLRARLLRYQSDQRAQQILQSQIRGVLETQDSTGAWWTVMNRPGDTYLEISATALLAYGMARAYRYGLASTEVLGPVENAVAAVESAIVRDLQNRPLVTGISSPTGVGTFSQYARVPLQDDLSYGVGGAILALVESSGLP